jgi:hypothetical protein
MDAIGELTSQELGDALGALDVLLTPRIRERLNPLLRIRLDAAWEELTAQQKYRERLAAQPRAF